MPFAVEVDTYRGGRRIALHEYPYRDDPWPEDTGRATRRITITGFLLGDDVFDQRAALIAALEQPGPGTLVHPSFGSITATLDGDFTIGQRKELGRVLQVEFGVIQTGAAQPLYPVADASTQDNARAAADTCDAACGSDFISDVTAALASGEVVVEGAVGTVAGFVATVVGTTATVALAAEQVLALPAVVVGSALATVGEVSGLVNDAGLIAGAAVGLVGNFGRYATGALTAPLPASATIASQIDALTVSRAAVGAACGAALATAASAPLGLPSAVQGAIASLVAAIPNPADQLRLLTVLACYSPAIPTATAPVGLAVATVQTAVAALIRRAALAALARAAAAYQPTSYDDAVAQIDALTAMLDAEAVIAADAGDSASYTALRGLRTAVTADLIARGAGLPRLITIANPAALPSLVLAYQPYGDATRSDDLIARADPVNPMFMPVSFVALSS